MARTLITGGCGFIGSHLAARLVGAGHSVDLVDDFSRAVADDDLRELLEQPGVRLIELDLLDPKAGDELGEDYELIFHLAAIVGVANVLERPYEVLRRNAEMTTNVLDVALRQRALGRLLFASTSEVYAGTLAAFGLTIPTPESTPIAIPDAGEPRSAYMLSKLYGEALCLQSGLPVTIARPHNVYGPRMGLSHVIPELLERAHKARDGGRLEVYSVDHRRTFCYVDDAVETIARAAEAAEATGEVLNVGKEGPEVEIGDLARQVIETVGRELEAVARPATPGSPPRRAPQMSRAEEITGYSARVELAEGLSRTYAWYAENVFAGLGVSAQ